MWSWQTCIYAGRSMGAPVLIVVVIRKAKSQRTTRHSIAAWRCLTSGRDAWLRAYWHAPKAMVALSQSPKSRASAALLFAAVSPSCRGQTVPTRSAFAGAAAGANAWKKTGGLGETFADAGRRRDCGRPDRRLALDAQVHAQAGDRPARPRLHRQRQHGGTLAQGATLFLAHQSQALGPHPRASARSAISPHRPLATALPKPRKSRSQYRHQKEGTGRAIQKPGTNLAAKTDRRLGPRLPQLSQRPRHSLWRLRWPAQHRVRGGGDLEGDARLRRRRFEPLVGRSRPLVLPQGTALVGDGGLRRGPQNAVGGPEGGPAARPRTPGPCHYPCALSPPRAPNDTHLPPHSLRHTPNTAH